MPILEHREAIKQYYDEVKSQYPNLSIEKFAEICDAPFEYIRQCIKSPIMPKILVKGLGKIRVTPAKIRDALKANEYFFNKGIIHEEYYNNRKAFLTDYLTKLEQDEQTNSEDQGFEITD